jgi:Protein of unknown function (DUF4013)
VNELSDSIAWPSRDPQWVSKVLLNGLILFIPIVGLIVVLGWMLATLDNLRAGRQLLPPAGFSYIGRGVNLFVVYLVYGIGLAVVFGVVFGVGLALSVTGNTGLGVMGGLLVLGAYGLILVGGLVLAMFGPAIIVATERGGIGGGLDVPAVIRFVSADFEMSLRVGLFALVSYVIGGIGAIACGIGQNFTTPYGYAVLAGVVHYYERNAGASAAPPPMN